MEQGQFFSGVQGQENLDEELLVLCFQRQGEAIDDTKKNTQGDRAVVVPEQDKTTPVL